MPRELDGVTGGSQRRSSRASSTSKTHVLDRFHAVRWFAWGLIEVRRARPTHRRQRGASRVRAVDLPFPLLTADLARSPESPAIRASHRSHLTGPELWHAWQLTQPLVRVYEADDEASARALLKEFVARYAELPIPEFKTILKLLAQWLPEILAFHSCDRITNGRLEGSTTSWGPKEDRLRVQDPPQLRGSGPAHLPCGGMMCRSRVGEFIPRFRDEPTSGDPFSLPTPRFLA